MEESLISQLQREFKCGEVDVRTYSPLTLAYIGDAIYDLMIRTVVVERGNKSANQLHRTTVGYVKAGTQARMIEALEQGFLTEEEESVYHRGRNAKSATSAKNASIMEYRKATGFEAVVGYLYLKGDTTRVIELVKKGLELIEMNL